jgi:hypothetical protein
LVCPSPLGLLGGALAGPHHQFEVEGGQDQQQALQGEATRLKLQLGKPGLAVATSLMRLILLALALLPP